MAFLIQPSSTKSAFGALPGRKIASSGPNICSSAVSSSISCAENQTVTEATIRYLPGLKDEEQNLSARRNFYPALEAKCITERLGGLPGLVSLPAGPTAGIFRHGTQDSASLARYMANEGRNRAMKTIIAALLLSWGVLSAGHAQEGSAIDTMPSAQIVEQAGSLHPSALYVLASRLLAEGKGQEAANWM